MPRSPEETGEDSWTGIDLEQWIGGHRTDPIQITSIHTFGPSLREDQDSDSNMVGGSIGHGESSGPSIVAEHHTGGQ